MDIRIPLLLSALATSVAIAQTPTVPAAGAPYATSADSGLTVHEWGTFTSFSGPSGDIVPFNITLGENLPDFVLARVSGDGWASVRDVPTFKFALAAEQRMETPVIYFHTHKPAVVSVNVRMPAGLITEVYPPVTSTTPATLASVGIPTAGSSIRWDNVSIVPSYCCDFVTFQPANANGDSHYFQARAVKAEQVNVGNGTSAYSEKFLFYRGIARGDMGLKAHPLGHDEFIIDRSQDGPLASVFAVEVAGHNVRFTQTDNVQPGAKLSLANATTTDTALGAAMSQALEKAGLYQDEATAMVNTWKHLWFGESGTRIMIIMPQVSIDKALPLEIKPSPKDIKRVFVARLEMLTPERQQWAQDLLARQAAATDADKQAIELELSTLGRFKDPAVQIVRSTAAKQAAKPRAN